MEFTKEMAEETARNIKRRIEADEELICWLEKRLNRCLKIDNWQRPTLEKFLNRLKKEVDNMKSSL